MALKDLREALLEIVDEMLREAEDLKGKPEDAAASYMASTLRGYAKQIKTACRAAGDDSASPPPPPSVNPLSQDPSLLYPSELFNRLQIEKAKAEFTKGKKGVIAEERYDGDMIEVHGGPANEDGLSTVSSIDPAMPIGAYTDVAGGVYQLRKVDGHRVLVYDDVQTKQRAKSIITG